MSARRKPPSGDRPYKPLIPPSTPGRTLLNRVADALEEGAKASWDDRILAAIMLVSVDCDEQRAREALRPSYEFYGGSDFGSSENGTEGQASFARDTVVMAARRLQEARSKATWERGQNALLAKRKSKLRVLTGGRF